MRAVKSIYLYPYICTYICRAAIRFQFCSWSFLQCARVSIISQIVVHSVSYVRSEVQPVKYNWRELPQVLFLSRQTRTRVCRDKTRLLSRQKYACHDKTFVATKLCLSRQIFVTTKVFCRDKHTFVATKMILVAALANDSKTWWDVCICRRGHGFEFPLSVSHLFVVFPINIYDVR